MRLGQHAVLTLPRSDGRDAVPTLPDSAYGLAEVIAQAMKDAGLIAEVAFTEHWAKP